MSRHQQRLRALERRSPINLDELSDEELEELAGTPTAEEQAWLDSLTNEELERLANEGIMPDERP